MHFYTVCSLLLFTCLIFQTTHAKRGGSSGGGGSVGSKSRGGILNSIKNSITGNRGTQHKPHGTWTGPTNTGFKAKPAAIPSYGKPTWMSGAGRSSYSSSRNKALLAGGLGSLAGAYVGYKVGRALSRPYHVQNGMHYYYGSRNYMPNQMSSSRRTCIFEVDPSTPNWNVQYPEDNSRVNEVIFECMSYESCCDMTCCRTPTHHRRNGYRSLHWSWWHSLLGFTVFAAIIFACTLALARLVRSRRQNSVPVVFTRYDETTKPLTAIGDPYPPPPPGTYSQPPAYPAGFNGQPVYPPQPYPAYPQAPPMYA